MTTKLKQYKLPIKYSKLKPYQKREIRLQYIKKQDDKCYYCKGDLDKEAPDRIKARKITPKYYPDGFFNHPVHLHHDHVTDLTLGAVHNYCNAVLWEYHGE
jgi:hypothetical protein